MAGVLVVVALGVIAGADDPGNPDEEPEEAVAGICTAVLHFGQATFLPAQSSGALSFASQLVQTTPIAIARPTFALRTRQKE